MNGKSNFQIFANFKKISSVYCFDLLSRQKIDVREDLIFFFVNVFIVNVIFVKQINSDKRPWLQNVTKLYLLKISRFLSIFVQLPMDTLKLCIRLTLNFAKTCIDSRLPMLLKNQKNMHPLALTPTKYHNLFFFFF